MSRMEVIVAKTAGFCFGVRRAVDQVYEQIEHGQGPIYTLGPIIHNEEVVKDLEEKGVVVLEDSDSLEQIGQGTVIIRSHGVGRQVYDQIKSQGLHLADATCPFVKKIHRIVEEQNRQGRRVIIIGDSAHPEVEGIRGWGDDRTLTVKNEKEMEALPDLRGEKLCIVSQTTYNYNKFKDLVEKFSEKGYDILVINTICNATQERQVEAERIASQVEAMVVIGGKNSSNTQKLFEICKKECENTYYIQTIDDLDVTKLQSIDSVGITAGASTPNYIIKEVQTNVRNEF